jgi:hypothetical protein
MADHPNVERLRRGYEAYARGDLATLRGMFADTITFHFLGHTQLSGTYNGLSEVLGYFERLQEIGDSIWRGPYLKPSGSTNRKLSTCMRHQRQGITGRPPLCRVC